MKSLFLLSILFLLTNRVFPQQVSPLISMESQAFNDFFMNPANTPVVKGKIINCPSELLSQLQIEYECIPPYNRSNDNRIAVPGPDGSFQFVLKYPVPFQQIFVFIQDYCYFQIHVTKELFIEIDMGQLQKNIQTFKGQGISFSGHDGALTTYLYQHLWSSKEQRTELFLAQSRAERDASLGIADYYKRCETIWKDIERLDSAFIAIHPSPYAPLIENIRTGEFLNGILMGGSYRFGNPDYTWNPIPPAYWEKCIRHQGYMANNTSRLMYQSLISYLTPSITFQYFSEFCQQLLKTPYLAEPLKKLLQQGSQLATHPEQNQSSQNKRISELLGEIQNYLNDEFSLLTNRKCAQILDSLFPAPKADLIKMNLIYGDASLQKKLIEVLLPDIKTPWCRKVLDDEYQQLLRVIGKEKEALSAIQPLQEKLSSCQPIGQTSFGARFYRIDSTTAQQFVTQLKNSFKGKALILDFWATWCGWCPATLQISANHQRALRNYPVEFIYLCTSSHSNEEKWKIIVTKYKIPGIHIFVDTKLNQQLLHHFSLPESVPQIILINSRGEYLPEAFPDHSIPRDVKDIINKID